MAARLWTMIIQSLFWSSLPGATAPGELPGELLFVSASRTKDDIHGVYETSWTQNSLIDCMIN